MYIYIMSVPFWSNDPTILLNKDYLFELWPSANMSFEEKLNAISRIVLFLTLLGFLFTRTIRILIVGIATLAIIFFLYRLRKTHVVKGMINNEVEGFSNNMTTNPVTLESVLKSNYVKQSKKNPFNNVLLTDIGDYPDREPAPPSFNPDVYEDINSNTKKMVQFLNPGIKNTNKQLFGDLGEKFNLDQSMIQYYSTPNTRVCNDQGAFANYLYGDMPSCRGGDSIECLKDNFRYTLY